MVRTAHPTTTGPYLTIIAFVTEAESIQRILTHLGEPTAPARGPLDSKDDINQTPVYDSQPGAARARTANTISAKRWFTAGRDG
jgi:hypothetical protein